MANLFSARIFRRYLNRAYRAGLYSERETGLGLLCTGQLQTRPDPDRLRAVQPLVGRATPNPRTKSTQTSMASTPVHPSVRSYIGQQLAEARERKGLTRVDLANRLGLDTHKAVAQRERGEAPISLGMFLQTCDALGVEFSTVLPILREYREFTR